MKNRFLSMLIGAVLFVLSAAAENYPYRSDVLWVTVPDHADWLYKTGEKAKIEVQFYKYGIPQDGVECDIWKSKDGVYVVSHDGHLRRMCGIDRWIPQMTFGEVISYPVTAGKKREEHPLQHLISFSQYLSIMARSETIHPIVELKMDYTTVELREIVDLVKQKGLLERTVFISMHLLALLRLKDIGIPASKLQYVYGAVGGNKWTKVSDELIAWLTENEISLDSRYTLVSKEDVEKLHKAGLFVNVWTVNKEEEMKRLLDEVGVDMVTTEYYFE